MEEESDSAGRPRSPQRRLRACVPCASAKARCHFQEANIPQHVCDRCQKLGIECTAKATKSVRRPRQIKPLDSRVAALEKELKDLKSLLCNPDASISSPAQASSVITADSSIHPAGIAGLSSSNSTASSADITHLAGGNTTANHAPEAGVCPLFDFTWLQANEVLRIFRDKYMPVFPFVLLRPDATMEQLVLTKPFTSRAIILVAAPLPIPRVRKIKEGVMSYLGQHLLVQDEMSLDILLGLLIVIAWYGTWIRESAITHLTYLALGYAHNLGLTRIPLSILQQMGLDNIPDDLRHSNLAAIISRTHSSEDQRALLGCYYLVSMNSAHFGRNNPMRSRYVDICSDSLGWARENETDFFAERNIRMMQIMEKIFDTFGSTNSGEPPKPYLTLLANHSRAIQLELDALLGTVNSEFDRLDAIYAPSKSPEIFVYLRKKFALEYNYLLMRLYEPATHLQKVSENNAAPDMLRPIYARNCLYAAKRFFDTLFALTSSEVIYETIVLMEHVTYMLVVTSRILLMDQPGWDLEHARATIDLLAVLDRLKERLLSIEVVCRHDAERFAHDVMGVPATPEEMQATGYGTEMAKKVSFLREWYDARTSGSTSAEWFAAGAGRDLLTELQAANGRTGGLAPGAASGGWLGGLFTEFAWDFDMTNAYDT
ncbi:hypothetical protein B0I35DRAFT_132422 [Stachybotrys elegans]|uniref:Zn(2)-C6 fungal-type domain-containing protein n=1 Tax=Stachybotrys elegans TaxID=80388 RepID=A0A8K0T4J1_9HYPO|nr:hypothetical protein B0I35DRAFT_132422 [Stachybotrys elegans]